MKLPIEIRKDSGVPIYVQFEEQMRNLIRSGTCKPGSPMPTVREMAVDMGLNYNTVARIYRDLQREGFLVLKRGIGTFVSMQIPTDLVRPQNVPEMEPVLAQLISTAREHGLKRSELLDFVKLAWDKGG